MEVKENKKKVGEITGLTVDEIKELNLWQKLWMATAYMERVNKNLKIELGGTRSYKAVSEEVVLEAVKKIEYELRIYSYPMARTIVDRDVLETEKEYKGNITRSNQLFMRIETRYFFVNIDKPEESLQVMSYGDGIDSGDKASGKAMTYADKYALMKAYKIETGDDPDKEASPELKSVKSMEDKRNSVAISDGQLATLEKWATTPERKANMLAELTAITKRNIVDFNELTLKEASGFIGAVIEKSKKKKEELKKDLKETLEKHHGDEDMGNIGGENA